MVKVVGTNGLIILIVWLQCANGMTTKLKWLRVCLVGRDITMFKRLPEATCNDFGEAIQSMRK